RAEHQRPGAAHPRGEVGAGGLSRPVPSAALGNTLRRSVVSRAIRSRGARRRGAEGEPRHRRLAFRPESGAREAPTKAAGADPKRARRRPVMKRTRGWMAALLTALTLGTQVAPAAFAARSEPRHTDASGEVEA